MFPVWQERKESYCFIYRPRKWTNTVDSATFVIPVFTRDKTSVRTAICSSQNKIFVCTNKKHFRKSGKVGSERKSQERNKELLSSRREIREKLERIRKGIHLIAHSDKHQKNIKSLPCQYKLEVKLTFSCQCSKSINTVTKGWGVGSGWRLLSRILPPYRHPRTRLCLPQLLIPRSSDWTVSGFLAWLYPRPGQRPSQQSCYEVDRPVRSQWEEKSWSLCFFFSLYIK